MKNYLTPAAVAMLGLAIPAQATLLVYEGNNYTTGSTLSRRAREMCW